MSDERDELEAYRRELEEATLEDLVRAVQETDDVTALRRLRASLLGEADRSTDRCGWVIASTGIEEVIGVTGLPAEVVNAFGGVDVADDSITVEMVGSVLHPTGVLARWEVYDSATLAAGIELETADGERWPLTIGMDDTERTVVLPPAYAVPVSGSEGLFTVAVTARAVPVAEGHLDDLGLLEVLVDLWASQPELAGARAGGGEDVRRTFEIAIAEPGAAALGVSPVVEVLLGPVETEVVLRPLNPSKPPSLSVRLGAAPAVPMELDGRDLVARLPAHEPLRNAALSIRRHDG